MIARQNSTNCTNCGQQDCPCSLIEVAGIKCTDVQKQLKINNFGAIVIDSNCRNKVVDIRKVITEKVLNEPVVLSIGNDLNGYTSDEVSLEYNDEAGVLLFNQEAVKSKFHKQAIFRIVWNPTNGTSPVVTLLSTQNITESISLQTNIVSYQPPGSPNIYYYIDCAIVGNEWDNSEQTTIIVDNNKRYNLVLNSLSTPGIEVRSIQNNGSSSSFKLMAVSNNRRETWIINEIIGSDVVGMINKFDWTPTTVPNYFTVTYTPVTEIEFYIYAVQKY